MLYSNIFIGVCAVSSLVLTKFLLLESIDSLFQWDVVFIFFSTISLYILHRIFGTKSIATKNWPVRFKEVNNAKKFNWGLLFFSATISLISYLYLPYSVQKFLLIPIILSLLYVTPFYRGKRLRDIHYIKIFLLAIVWSWLTVLFAFSYLSKEIDEIAWWLFLERTFFIFAITIPFDIRDKHIDKLTNLNTLVSSMGISFSKTVAQMSLFISIGILSYMYIVSNFINVKTFVGFLLVYAVCAVLIQKSTASKNDFYYTGLVDGMMILLTITIIMINKM